MLIPRKCGNVSPQCPVGQERGYRLGWYWGQIAMADEYDGTPGRVVELENEVERLKGIINRAGALASQEASLEHIGETLARLFDK